MRRLFFGPRNISALLFMACLAVLQVYILYELNGHLYEILTDECPNLTVIGTLFMPMIAMTIALRSYAARSRDDLRETPEDPT